MARRMLMIQTLPRFVSPQVSSLFSSASRCSARLLPVSLPSKSLSFFSLRLFSSGSTDFQMKIGQQVSVDSGKYAGQEGEIQSLTSKMVGIKLKETDQVVRLSKIAVSPISASGSNYTSSMDYAIDEGKIHADADPQQLHLLDKLLDAGDYKAIHEMAESGIAVCQCYLGVAYMHGDDVIEPDEKKSKMWLERGARSGDLESTYQLGSWHLNSEKNGDLSVARRLWKKAAYHGHFEAMYKYGCVLYNGDGGNRDNEEARRLLTIAVENGVLEGAPHLARLMTYGIGGPVDKEGADHWERVAAEEDDEYAERLMQDRDELKKFDEQMLDNIKSSDRSKATPPRKPSRPFTDV